MTNPAKANSKVQMAPASNEEQFKFLISCIRYSNNGKVDFSEVARECSIVTKGAAAKRYERMMKAHGIHQSAATVRDTPIPSRSKESKISEPKSSISKKRKLDQFADDDNNTPEDDEDYIKVKPEPAGTIIKEEPAGTIVKEEPSTAEENPLPAGMLHFQDDAEGHTFQTDGTMFNDFLHSSAFSRQDDEPQASYDSAYDQPVYGGMGAVPEGGNGHAIHESILITD